MALLKTLELLKAGERVNDFLERRTTERRPGWRPYRLPRTSGTRGSAVMLDQLRRTWSSAGSYEQAMVLVSPARALR